MQSTLVGDLIGVTRIRKLILISKNYPAAKDQMLRAALSAVKGTLNVRLYAEVVGLLGEAVDASLTSDMKHAIQTKAGLLETSIDRHKRELDHKSLFDSYIELGLLRADSGDYEKATQATLNAKEHCDKPSRLLYMYLLLCMFAFQYDHTLALFYYQQATNVKTLSENKELKVKFDLCIGLYHMITKEYAAAASCFLQACVGGQLNFNEMATSRDLVVYCGLSTIASFVERSELKALLDAPGFKDLVEFAPDMRNLISSFLECDYRQYFSSLDSLSKCLSIDPFLHHQSASLISLIRDRSFLQYCAPFITIDLRKMSGRFGISVQELKDQLARLVFDGKIQAKIDSCNNILELKTKNQRQCTFKDATFTGDVYLSDALAACWRMTLIHNKVICAQDRWNHHDLRNEM